MSRNGWGKIGSQTIAYVLGDYMTDVYQNVRVTKIAPDAPAPVWELDGEPVEVPGGAGNVAAQFLHLAGDVTLAALAAIPGTNTTIRNNGRLRTLSRSGPTSRKTRFVSNGHVLARLDSPAVWHNDATRFGRTRELLAAIDTDLRDRSVINGTASDGRRAVAVLSDYAGGFWDVSAALRAVGMFRSYGVPVVVDPKPGGVALDNWQGVTVVKLNESEARRFAGCDDVRDAARECRRVVGCPVVVTRGAASPVLAGFADVAEFSDYATDRPLWASGAGDCFAAYLAAGVAGSGLTVPVVGMAHAAGAVYTRKRFNAAVHPREAMELRDPTGAKLYGDPVELASRLSALPPGTRVGYTNGCFDLLHPGHVALLDWARKQCDFLCVFVNSDASVKTIKGDEPVMKLAERVAMLAAVGSVGAVIGYDEPTPAAVFDCVGRCDVLVKGEEYRGKRLAGEEYAERVELAPEVYKVHSSEIVRRVIDREEVEPGSRSWEG